MTLKQTDFIHKLQTVLLTICTSAILGCFGFLWHINSELQLRQDKDNEHDKQLMQLHDKAAQHEAILNAHSTRISVLEYEKTRQKNNH